MNNSSYISCLVFAVLVFWIGFALKRCPSALRVLRRDVLAVLLVFAVAASLVADKTNGLMRIIGQLRSPAPVAVTVTAEDIARGWRIESISTHETMSYEMPTNATYVGNWHVHGARSSFGRNVVAFGPRRSADPAEWAFPLGTNFESFTSFWYFVDARIRPTPRDAAREIRAAGGPMFAAPGLSRLWTAEESDGGQSLTWENFFLGNDTNTPVNAQIRLYGNGDFTTSSNQLVTVCRRVEPFDWDGDGISNSIDPDPYTGSADCHGTCAAWYNIACSNILTAVDGDCGVELAWRDGVNQNAYYFVEVVAESGPAQIVFSASQAGNLGSPVIVAYAGETNTVPLLVGVEYAVTSTVPISVSAPSDGYAQVTFDTPKTCRIHWPISFVFTEAINGPTQSGGTSRTYSVTASPYDPGGVFSWGPACLCGCMTCSGSAITFACTPGCACGASCGAAGTYGYEGLVFQVSGGECRCGFNDPLVPSQPSYDPESGPTLSIQFSTPVLIFKESCETAAFQSEPKKSTRVVLTIDAYGGPYGGQVSISSANTRKIVSVGLAPLLSDAFALAPGESYHATAVYEGAEASEVSEDVTVSGSIVENFSGAQQVAVSASLTVVKIEVKQAVEAPVGSYANRRRYGIAEDVLCIQNPVAPVLQWRTTGNGVFSNGTTRVLSCPMSSESCRVYAEHQSASLFVVLDIVEPDGIVCDYAEFLPPSSENTGCGMLLKLKVSPFDVSFSNLKMQEIPADPNNGGQWGTHTGYFGSYAYAHRWYHTVMCGAGIWIDVDEDNVLGWDESRIWTWEKPWANGVLTWRIPYGWKRKDSLSDVPVGQIQPSSYSTWTMNASFLEKSKHSHRIGESFDGRMYFEGVQVNENN